MASLFAISNRVNISSHVDHALSVPTSSNSRRTRKQLIPGSSSHEKRSLLITTASLSPHVRDRSLDSSNKAAQRCRDDEVDLQLPSNTRPEEKSIIRPVNRLCVFSGSCSAEAGIYTHVAHELGTELVQRGITLVYGGGSSRLMGKAAENGGGHVVGVIPQLQALMQRGVLRDKIADLVTVNDMDRRRWLPEMIRRADAFLALPGGLGALDEVDEMITMSDLGLHKKPVGLLNVNGFYDPIISSWLKSKAQQFRSFQKPKDDIMESAATVPELVDRLQGYPNTQQLWTAAYN